MPELELGEFFTADMAPFCMLVCETHPLWLLRWFSADTKRDREELCCIRWINLQVWIPFAARATANDTSRMIWQSWTGEGVMGGRWAKCRVISRQSTVASKASWRRNVLSKEHCSTLGETSVPMECNMATSSTCAALVGLHGCQAALLSPAPSARRASTFDDWRLVFQRCSRQVQRHVSQNTSCKNADEGNIVLSKMGFCTLATLATHLQIFLKSPCSVNVVPCHSLPFWLFVFPFFKMLGPFFCNKKCVLHACRSSIQLQMPPVQSVFWISNCFW